MREKESREAYDVLTSFLDEYEIREASAEVFDSLYETAFRYNKAKSFEYVCIAHAKDYGWGWDYGRPKPRQIQRWQFVVSHFKDKHTL